MWLIGASGQWLNPITGQKKHFKSQAVKYLLHIHFQTYVNAQARQHARQQLPSKLSMSCHKGFNINVNSPPKKDGTKYVKGK